MTEDEAKTKWCPFVNFFSAYMGGVYHNRGGVEQEVTATKDSVYCIGSKCMMWRTGGTYKDGDWVVRGRCGIGGEL